MSQSKGSVKYPTRELKNLAQWFERQKRVLPWRERPTPYRVWVSEIMLQQTQVVTVIPYFERFMKQFPTLKKLSEASEAKVLQYWSGLGYYSRARNLKKTADIVAQNKGRFPTTREGWEALPGIGPYTAGAILSIAQNQPEAILDGNVERVLSRVYEIGTQEESKEGFKAKLWEKSRLWIEHAFDKKLSPSDINQGLMEVGALICSPKKPKCLFCPLQKGCQSFKNQTQEAYPPKRERKKWVQIEESKALILFDSGEVLLRNDPDQKWRKGLFDLPDQPKKSLQNELRLTKEITFETKHVVTHHKIKRTTTLYRAKNRSHKLDQSYMICKPDDLEQVPHSAALKKTLKSMRSLDLSRK